MRVRELPISVLGAAEWNPNVMDASALDLLRASIQRFGMIVPLVVRHLSMDAYETIGGAHRLQVLTELGIETAPCVVVEADDAEARLLAQALNRIQGEDDIGLRAESLRCILDNLSHEEVLSILPETTESLNELATLGTANLSEHLQAWQEAQASRLKHLTFQLTPVQLELVEEALEMTMDGATKPNANPNRRGNALFNLCKVFLQFESGDAPSSR